MKFPKIKDGQRVRPKMEGYLMGCCDCGLVHTVKFEVTRKGNVVFRVWRNEEETKRLRSKK